MIKCLAIDDETLALDLLEDNISQVPFLHLVKRCKNAFEAMEILQKEPIDLLFMDIQMPGINGLQLLESLPNKPMVIFITAHKQYALEGYNHDVIDFLVKPVPIERFLKAANKALEFHNLKNKHIGTTNCSTDYIFVNAEYSLVKIMLNEITHIEGDKDYVKIHLTTSEKPVVTRLSFKNLEEKLDVQRFPRVHKSFIVATDKIVSIRHNIINIGTTEVPLGSFYRDKFYELISPESVSA